MESKKNIVVFAGDIYPNPSPNGVCLSKLIDSLKEYYNFTIIMIDQSNTAKQLTIDGVEYINITCFTNRIQNYAVNKKGIVVKIFQVIAKLARGVKTAVTWMRYEGFYYRGCIHVIKRLLKNKKIDCIIAACYPFSAVYAAYVVKKKFAINYITYILDDYSSARNLRKICLFRNRFERKDVEAMKNLMLSAKVNFVTEGFLHSKIFADVKENVKSKIVGFPLLDAEIKNISESCCHEIPQIVFTGSFVQGVREPNALMKLFSFDEVNKVKLTLCTRGNYQDVLAQWAQHRTNIDYKGTVSREVSMQMIESADILLNVDNMNLHQIPSKIFEYMQTGKPIINLYYYKEQKSLLSNYPNVIQIDQNDITDNSAKEVVKFCFANMGKTCDTALIYEKYKIYTKQYLTEIFKKEIEA